MKTYVVVWKSNGLFADKDGWGPNEYNTEEAAWAAVDSWLFNDHRYYLVKEINNAQEDIRAKAQQGLRDLDRFFEFLSSGNRTQEEIWEWLLGLCKHEEDGSVN